MSVNYYLFDQGEQRGPLTLGQLRAMWRAGSITAEAQICQAGDEDWRAAADVLDSEPATVDAAEDSGLHAGPVMVALGTGLCAVSVIGFFTAPAMIALSLLGIGFFLAVIGRLCSGKN
jgi:hypothetical protein